MRFLLKVQFVREILGGLLQLMSYLPDRAQRALARGNQKKPIPFCYLWVLTMLKMDSMDAELGGERKIMKP